MCQEISGVVRKGPQTTLGRDQSLYTKGPKEQQLKRAEANGFFFLLHSSVRVSGQRCPVDSEGSRSVF